MTKKFILYYYNIFSDTEPERFGVDGPLRQRRAAGYNTKNARETACAVAKGETTMIATRIAPCEGWEQCLWMTNGIVEVAATLKAGIRLIHYGFPGKENMLRVLEEKEQGEDGEQVGGHRLQTSPGRGGDLSESPIQWEETENSVRLMEQPGPGGLKKTLEVAFVPGSSEVVLKHVLILCEGGAERCEDLTGWSVTMMEEGGLAVLPQTRGNSIDLAPNRLVALWPGTSMADPRILWGQDHILVQQANMRPAKLGISCEDGWAAYFNMGDLFVLRFQGQDRVGGSQYADGGCCLEVATGEKYTELVTLTPKVCLRAGESLSFRESWTLYGDIPCPPMDEQKIVEALRGIL